MRKVENEEKEDKIDEDFKGTYFENVSEEE